MLRFVPLASIALGLAAGCGPSGIASDAGTDARYDAGLDASRDDSGVDSGRCNLECMPGRVCCPNALGESVCVNLSTDALNCGTCGRDCVAQRRGDSCVDFQCSCGSAEIGCTGGLSSVCCAPSVPGGPGYCANLGREPGNCGTCGFTCVPERANQCEGGMCTCGLSGAQCAGTAEDRCCQRDADPFACVDTTTAMDHCGVCGHRCNAFEICTAGVCTSTQPDAGITAPDTGTSDGGLDAGADAGLDTGLDAGTDAG